jgi:hypothetical protein
MVLFFEKIAKLIEKKEIKVSEHGYDELVEDAISVRDILNGIAHANPVEYYPEFKKGPCILVLQRDSENRPVHVVWGIPKGSSSPTVLVTAYRSDPKKWSDDFLRRLK